MKSKSKIILPVFAAALIFAAGVGGFLFSSQQRKNIVRRSEVTTLDDSSAEDSSAIYTRDSFDGSVSYNGKRYEVNTSIDKILFLGIDNSDQSRDGIGIDEGGRSDTIILFAIDNENETITPLEINRDTMVDVDIYDNDGNYLTQGTRQLTMQYSYGNTPKKASNLTKEKISDLLCRTKIDGVISLTMDGIEPIVDSIGGVTLTLTTDETDLDPSYVKGAVIHLDGAAAKDFVHTRDTDVRGSNIMRMSRQTQFMMALFHSMKGQGESIVDTMEKAAGDYLYEDIDADSMAHFVRYDYSGDIFVLPGVNKTEGLHDEFYVDENKLTEMVLKLFYKEI
ncbi:LCP family protein [Butyrivibrio sp. MC2021]|uniref:LCP family protein n=1 Tax=Butyrivibrio sp. MC2021 TaxID=1408306 RepID=UPI0004794227|nr:LCP family protein [Butyrivibrio sp. MC2021]